MARVKALFYIRLRDNDGQSLAQETADLELELYARFVGWTLQGQIKGTYRMPDGSRSLDVSGAYVVILEESRVSELEQVLRDFRSKTQQDAIYLEIQRDVDVRMIR
jgi:hypothetical protein